MTTRRFAMAGGVTFVAGFVIYAVLGGADDPQGIGTRLGLGLAFGGMALEARTRPHRRPQASWRADPTDLRRKSSGQCLESVGDERRPHSARLHGPLCFVKDDVGRVLFVARPRRRPVRTNEGVRERLARLPIAGAKSPDVGVEQVVGEIDPCAMTSHFGRQGGRVAIREPRVVGTATGGRANLVAAGETPKSVFVHLALRSNRTYGAQSRCIRD